MKIDLTTSQIDDILIALDARKIFLIELYETLIASGHTRRSTIIKHLIESNNETYELLRREQVKHEQY